METLFIYLVKVNIALAMFYLMYVGLLRKDTFLRLKRFYLFAAIVFSLVYPLFTIEVGGNIFSFLRKNYAAEVLIGQPSIAPGPTDASAENHFFPLHGENIFFFVMMAGTAFFLVRFIWQLITIFRIKHKSVPKRIGTQNVYHFSEKMMPFSFFRWIFINTDVHSEEELKQILLHEQIHVQQWHSLDIVLAESLCIFFWWNPIVWLMKKEIAINLEYLADSEILRKGVNSRDYQYHLLRLTYRETAVQIVNNFNVSQLKQRIMMMNKNKSPKRKLAKYLMILPLAVVLMMTNCVQKKDAGGVSSQEETVQDEKQQKVTDNDEIFVVVEEMPQFPGGQEALMKYLSENIHYPKEAQEKGIEGRVICSFIVGKDGSITDVEVVRGVDPSLDEEAIRIIKSMPKWEPGRQRGKVVDVRFTLPIIFRLQPSGKPVQNSTDNAEGKISDTEAKYFKFISENIRYPVIAQENGIMGLVKAKYSVNEKGEISNVKIIQGVDPSLDAEVMRVIKTLPPDIALAKTGGKANSNVEFSAYFRLQDDESSQKISNIQSEIVVVGYGKSNMKDKE